MQDWLFEVGGNPSATMMTLDPWADQATGWTEPETVEPPRDDWLAAFLTTSTVMDGLDPLFMPPTGDDPPPHELDDVIITRPKPPPKNPYTPPHKPGPPPGVWIDEGRDPPPPGGTGDPVAKQTDCVETDFIFGAHLTEVNNAALAASIAIGERNDEIFEYSSIIWVLNDTVGWTTPYTNGIPGRVNLLGSLDEVPTGATIVGIVHNHPDQGNIKDGVPADEDWDSYDKIVGHNGSPPISLPRAIAADPNMLLYVKTDEDGKTRVYDRSDRRTQMNSCSID